MDGMHSEWFMCMGCDMASHTEYRVCLMNFSIEHINILRNCLGQFSYLSSHSSTVCLKGTTIRSTMALFCGIPHPGLVFTDRFSVLPIGVGKLHRHSQIGCSS